MARSGWRSFYSATDRGLECKFFSVSPFGVGGTGWPLTADQTERRPVTGLEFSDIGVFDGRGWHPATPFRELRAWHPASPGPLRPSGLRSNGGRARRDADAKQEDEDHARGKAADV